MRIESGIILGILAGGPGTPLFGQIFAPELDPEGTYTFPKTRLPDKVWDKVFHFFYCSGLRFGPPSGSTELLLRRVMAQHTPRASA